MYHHYIFTPRDVSNWLIGLLRYECKKKDDLIKIWAYECIRVFKDKLLTHVVKSSLINEASIIEAI